MAAGQTEDVEWDKEEKLNDDGWDNVELNKNQKEDELLNEWQIKVYNKFTSGILEKRNNKDMALKLFLECIKLEESNTNIIHRRFFAMKEILLIKSEYTTNDQDNEILNYFQQLLTYYDPNNSSFD